MRRTLFPNCRNKKCEYQENAPKNWYRCKGSFKLKWNNQPVPRYQCKSCKRTFSSHTYREHYLEKKPYLNEGIRDLLCRDVCHNDIARHFGVSLGLVLRRLVSLGKLSKEAAQERWKSKEEKTSYVQFDEIRTCHRTMLLPLVVAFAMRPKDGHIISAHVGEAPYIGSGDGGRLSRKKFGERRNDSEKVVRALLRDVKNVVRDKNHFTIASDKNVEYSKLIANELPFAKHESFDGGKLKTTERSLKLMDLNDQAPKDYSNLDQPIRWWITKSKSGRQKVRAYDPLFHINQKCAFLRAKISRLRKHTWGFTQKVENLEHHLWIFIAHHNGYRLKR